MSGKKWEMSWEERKAGIASIKQKVRDSFGSFERYKFFSLKLRI